MKKLLGFILLLILTGCTKDIEFIGPVSEVPESLKIENIMGVKLESVFVSGKVSMNVKLPEDGIYRIKIRDIDNTLISQEKINAQQGDNILSVYTNSLEKSSYTIELTTDEHGVLGRAVFVNQ